MEKNRVSELHEVVGYLIERRGRIHIEPKGMIQTYTGRGIDWPIGDHPPEEGIASFI